MKIDDPPGTADDGGRYTYPTLMGRLIVEMTSKQRKALVERNLTIEQRVARVEAILRQQGLLEKI